MCFLVVEELSFGFTVVVVEFFTLLTLVVVFIAVDEIFAFDFVAVDGVLLTMCGSFGFIVVDVDVLKVVDASVVIIFTFSAFTTAA